MPEYKMCNGICYLDCCCCTLAKKRCNFTVLYLKRFEVGSWKFRLRNPNLWQCLMSDTITAVNSRVQTGRRPVDDITMIILLLHRDFGSVWRTTALSYWNRAGLQLIVLWSTNPHLPFQDVFPFPCRVYVTITTATFLPAPDLTDRSG